MAFDPVKNVLDIMCADPLIDPAFKRGLRSADKTHREFKDMRDFWQPIETAPKDGTAIILCGPYNDTSICRWDGNKEWEVLADGAHAIEHMSDFGTDYKSFDHPSRWMPVPAKPVGDH